MIPGDGVVPPLPFLHIHLRPVCERVVASRVMTNSVAHGLNQHRFLLFYGESTGSLSHLVDRHDVVSVHPDSVDTVSKTARGNPVTFVLLESGRGDGVSVVSAEEDDRAVPGCRNVERRVEVAFRCRSFAEIAYDDVGRILHFHGICCTNGMGNLGR